MIWTERPSSQIHARTHKHTHTQHKKKTNIQPARFVSTGQKATELVHQVNTPLCRDLVCSDIDAGSLGGGWMGGGADTLAAAAIKESERGSALVSSWLDPTSYRVHGASKFTGRLERLLKSFPPPQSFFCSFSWFFWNFWWTTFKVVREFPRNRTRNVSASMNTWNKKDIKKKNQKLQRWIWPYMCEPSLEIQRQNIQSSKETFSFKPNYFIWTQLLDM